MKTKHMNAFRGNSFYLTHMLNGLTDDDLMLSTGESNTIGWIFGHIIYYRGTILKNLNCEVEISEDEKLFERGAKKNKEIRVNLKNYLDEFSSRGEKIVNTLSSMTNADLERKIEIQLPGGKNDIETLLSFLSWHETFHLGQIDLIKAAVGKGGMK